MQLKEHIPIRLALLGAYFIRHFIGLFERVGSVRIANAGNTYPITNSELCQRRREIG